MSNKRKLASFGEKDLVSHLPTTGEVTVEDQLRLCSSVLAPQYVDKRPGAGGQQFMYWKGHNAIKVANCVFGSNKWDSEMSDLRQTVTPTQRGVNVVATCLVKIKIRWADGSESFHQDVGVGCKDRPSQGQADAVEQTLKEAVTDGLKRALRQFGEGFGNCLYDKRYRDWVDRVLPKNVPSAARYGKHELLPFPAEAIFGQEMKDEQPSSSSSKSEDFVDEDIDFENYVEYDGYGVDRRNLQELRK